MSLCRDLQFYAGSAFFVLMLAGPAYSQSEAEKAVSLIRASMQCPIKPVARRQESVSPTDCRSLVALNFLGDTQLLKYSEERIDRCHRLQSNEVNVSSGKDIYTMRYSAIKAPTIEVDEDDKVFYVIIECSQGKSCVAGQHFQSSNANIQVCDKETAENMKLAIDTLIRLSKGSAPK